MAIEKLTAETLMNWLEDPACPCLIEFHASWCIYHLLTKRKMQSLSEMLDQDIRVGSIDSVGNEDFFRSIGIQMIPSIAYFDGTQRHVWVGDTDLDVILEGIQAVRLNQPQRVFGLTLDP